MLEVLCYYLFLNGYYIYFSMIVYTISFHKFDVKLKVAPELQAAGNKT